MASSRYLITSTTLGSSAASVTFSSIPATYTDLILKISGRNSYSATLGDFTVTGTLIGLNGSPTSPSNTYVYGNGSSAVSGRLNDGWMEIWGDGEGAQNTANTFSNTEFYLPNYTGSAKKVGSGFAVMEQNGTTGAFVTATAMLDQRTTSVTSIVVAAGAGSFVANSTFTLYGLKNS